MPLSSHPLRPSSFSRNATTSAQNRSARSHAERCDASSSTYFEFRRMLCNRPSIRRRRGRIMRAGNHKTGSRNRPRALLRRSVSRSTAAATRVSLRIVAAIIARIVSISSAWFFPVRGVNHRVGVARASGAMPVFLHRRDPFIPTFPACRCARRYWPEPAALHAAGA